MALDANGAKFEPQARESAISRPRNRGGQNSFVQYRDRLRSSVFFRGDRWGGGAGIARSCRSPCIKSRQPARQGRGVSSSHFASALPRRGILLSANENVLATPRRLARCSWINPSAGRGHDARENALRYRLDAIRERKNTRRIFHGYAEARTEHDPDPLVVVSRNERDISLSGHAAQSRGKNGHS